MDALLLPSDHTQVPNQPALEYAISGKQGVFFLAEGCKQRAKHMRLVWFYVTTPATTQPLRKI